MHACVSNKEKRAHSKLVAHRWWYDLRLSASIAAIRLFGGQAMKKIRLTYRVTTPMFLGGAGHSAELREQSFKGALRFWWRTLPSVRDQTGGGNQNLLRQESEIFGSSDQNIGRSKVRLRIIEKDLSLLEAGNVLWSNEAHQARGNERRGGAFYLGYGLINAFYSSKTGKLAGQLSRDCFMPGTFTIQVALDRRLNDQQLESVHDALRLLGAVGGLGARSRRGYGSLSLVSWKRFENGQWVDTPGWCPETPAQTLETLGLLGSESIGNGVPDWTSWSKNSRAVVFDSDHGSVRELLDNIGRELLYYRGWGFNRKVLGVNREENFPHDHHLFKNRAKNGHYNLPANFDYPLRTAFGLPHNYGKPPRTHVTPAGSLNGKSLERRASPLFIHIHQPDHEQPPSGLVFSLPARFLPDDSNGKQRVRAFDSAVELNTSSDFWNPVNGFLDRLAGTTDPGNPLSGTAKKTSLNGREIGLCAAGGG